jgi:SAM-dependent methyltransferase
MLSIFTLTVLRLQRRNYDRMKKMRFLFKSQPYAGQGTLQKAEEKPTYLERLARYGVNGAHPGGLNLTRLLLRSENPGATDVVLDVGCGVGQTAAYLGQHYPCKITAVDINPQMVALARQKFARMQLNINLQQADATALPLRGKSVDIVLSESVTVFTPIPTALNEYYRVLKPGGRLLAIEVTADKPLAAAELNVVQQILGITQIPTPELWRQMFTNAGFTTVQVLARAKINPTGLNSYRHFRDYHLLMLKYNAKLQYAVFRCQK